MKFIAINGSPRKNKNTATLLHRVLEGAASQGAETEFIHLYDLHYKGCISCFACKRKNGKSYGKCALKDELTPILEKIAAADGVILGSPIYLRSITGAMRSFLERLIYQYLVYDPAHSSLFKKKIPIALIYTMNWTNTQMKDANLEKELEPLEMCLQRTFGYVETFPVNDTYQFDDYTKYVAPIFDENKKAKVREEQFPKDCEKAVQLGIKLTKQINI